MSSDLPAVLEQAIGTGLCFNHWQGVGEGVEEFIFAAGLWDWEFGELGVENGDCNALFSTVDRIKLDYCSFCTKIGAFINLYFLWSRVLA